MWRVIYRKDIAHHPVDCIFILSPCTSPVVFKFYKIHSLTLDTLQYLEVHLQLYKHIADCFACSSRNTHTYSVDPGII